jgi:uncharacterized protein (UPF0332 family)
MSSGREAYLRFRLERARQTLQDARLLAESGRLHSAVNRLYYACFYCVSALVSSEGHKASKHSGVRALFNRHWVKTGRVSTELGGFYSSLFDLRQKADYADLVRFEPEQVRCWVEQAAAFVPEVSRLVDDRFGDQAGPPGGSTR